MKSRDPDWFDRWHAALERYDRTADAAIIRFLSWIFLTLGLLVGWMLLNSSPIDWHAP